jgi:hypothetical protein
LLFFWLVAPSVEAVDGTGHTDSANPGAGLTPPGTQEGTKVSPESFEPLSRQGFSELEKKAAAGDAVVSLDPDKNRFSLGGTAPEAVKRSALTIPLKEVPSHNGLVIEASVNGVGPLYFELDTGNNGCISLSQRDWQWVFAHGEPRTSQRYSAGVGDQVEQHKVARVQSLDIGTNQLNQDDKQPEPGFTRSCLIFDNTTNS